MSIQLIQQYYNNVDKLIRYGGTRNETSLRKAFQELLDHYARSKNLLLVPFQIYYLLVVLFVFRFIVTVKMVVA
jgi:hypothetical protein